MNDQIVPTVSPGRRLNVHELSGPVNPGCLEKVDLLLRQVWATSADVSGTDRIMFETAVIEIAANIIQHGSAEVSINCTLTIEVYPDRLDAQFRDDGIAALVDLDTASMPDPLAESGRGIAMAKASLDVLAYERHNDKNVWTLSRLRTAS